MPHKPYKYKLTQTQRESSRKLRALLGLSQEELHQTARELLISLSRSTIQRAEGYGGGWVKPRTRLDLIKVYELSIKKSGLSKEDKASCHRLLDTLRGDGAFVHQNRYRFISAVTPPSLISLHEVKTRIDLKLWWDSVPDGPSIFDNVKIESKAALAEFESDDFEWLDRNQWSKQGFSPNSKIGIDREDLDGVDQATTAFRAWVETWDAPFYDDIALNHLAQHLECLYAKGIVASIGLALASTIDPSTLPAWHHGSIVRKWRAAIAFGLQPIDSFQVWWQQEDG